MKELLLTLSIFGLLTIAILALAARALSAAMIRKIREESLTPRDLSALESAADELVQRMNDAADAAISRLEAKEKKVRELLRTGDAALLSSSDSSTTRFSE